MCQPKTLREQFNGVVVFQAAVRGSGLRVLEISSHGAAAAFMHVEDSRLLLCFHGEAAAVRGQQRHDYHMELLGMNFKVILRIVRVRSAVHAHIIMLFHLC